MSLRALVADDAILFRRVISDALGTLPDVQVVGSAHNGRAALQKIKELKPDFLTLDLEMPELDGLGVLDALRQAGDKTPVIVVSALTKAGGALTMRALDKGAFDFITKPDGGSAEASREQVRRELLPRVRAISHRVAVRSILAPSPAAPAVARPIPASAGIAPARLNGIADRMQRLAAPAGKPEFVLVGVSTGGPQALTRLLPQIPGNLEVPILVVQHMPPVFTQSLAESLASKCSLKVREASPNEAIESGVVYIAPGGRQMRVGQNAAGGRVIQITDDPPENNCRPAVDYLFRSAAAQFPGKSLAVILTGMGSDGTIGLRLLKKHGCFAIAQDESSCVVYGMPRAAAEAGVVDAVLPLDAIAAKITSVVRGCRS